MVSLQAHGLFRVVPTSFMASSAKTRVTAPKAPATTEQMTSTKDSSKTGPIWKTQSNRVQGAIWKHSQKGETRYTTAISRSYFDKKAGEWKNVFFYDEQ